MALICMVSYADDVAQCKLDANSYVVASQPTGGTTVTLTGYGECANCTVVVVAKSSYGTETKAVKIVNGSGTCTFSVGYRLVEAKNIVCN